jgi:Cu(I)/Ag(I) efflux system membrane protein CusA/SilA
MDKPQTNIDGQSTGPLSKLIRFCLENKLVVGLFVVLVVGAGLYVAPFDWDFRGLPRDPLAVDAIPDIGENQQIVFTKWMGRSPQDVEDQITYPLTVSLLGIPGVKTVRSYSFFGFSSIYLIFEESVDFYPHSCTDKQSTASKKSCYSCNHQKPFQQTLVSFPSSSPRIII